MWLRLYYGAEANHSIGNPPFPKGLFFGSAPPSSKHDKLSALYSPLSGPENRGHFCVLASITVRVFPFNRDGLNLQ